MNVLLKLLPRILQILLVPDLQVVVTRLAVVENDIQHLQGDMAHISQDIDNCMALLQAIERRLP